ncbi:hypothetical protein FRB99_000565 [Tulasnella sp. 403]|nr:hypothetical protein FRB99_000565 [Tulasnella sp. 403]
MVSSVQEIIAVATATSEVPAGWEEIFCQLAEADILHLKEDRSVAWATESLDISSIISLYAEYKEVEVEEKEPSAKTKEEELVWREGQNPSEQNGTPIGWGETQPSWEVTKEVKKEEEIPMVEEEVTLDCPTVDQVNYHYQQPTPLPQAWWENQDLAHPDWLGSHANFTYLYKTEQFTYIKEDFKVLEEQLEAIRTSARWIFQEKTINLQNYEERYREVYPADEKSPFFTPFAIEGPLMTHGLYTSYFMQIERIMEEYIKARHQAQFWFKVVKEANPIEVSAQEVMDLVNDNPQYKCLVQQFRNHLPHSFNYF